MVETGPDDVTSLLAFFPELFLGQNAFILCFVLYPCVTHVRTGVVDTTRVIILEVDTHTIPSVELSQIGVSIAEVTTQSTLVTLDKWVSHLLSLLAGSS